MQTITPALQAILKAKFQAASSGFRGRVLLSSPATVPSLVQESYKGNAGGTLPTPADPAPGNLMLLWMNSIAARSGNYGPWTELTSVSITDGITTVVGSLQTRIAQAGDTAATLFPYDEGGAGAVSYFFQEWTNATVDAFVGRSNHFGLDHLISDTGGGSGTGTVVAEQWAGGALTPSLGVPVAILGFTMIGCHGGLAQGLVNNSVAMAGDTQLFGGYYGVSDLRPVQVIVRKDVVSTIGAYTVGSTITQGPPSEDALLCGLTLSLIGTTPDDDINAGLVPEYINIDKSLTLIADQAEVQFSNENLPLGWGPDNVFKTNQRIRIYQWYGDTANAVRTFTGVVDKVADHRDVLSTTISCRDMMAILIDQTFSATAPQGAGETGAVRTEANGVYLGREVDYIVGDILNRAGWPSTDRVITPTSYVLDEFIVQDGASWAATIIGASQLTGLVGYDAWADEAGVFRFTPTLVTQNLTSPLSPVYTFRSGEDLMALDDTADQYALRTRVKVRGPLTTQTLQDTWRELWSTSKLSKPVGIWYDPADSANIRVVDRGTKRLYKIRQSDRAVLSSVYLGGVIAHPLGLSGDPADSSVYWVLNAPWIDGGSGGNQAVKVRKSDNHVLATLSLPSGRWSALKVSSAHLWLTNLDTDRFYSRSKTTGGAVADYSHTYSSVVQLNPSGIMVDGTTLYLFWSNGGTTARFLKCDESAPGTVTGVVKTAGTVLHGGEMDTTTHTECYGDSDSLGLVAKFTLLLATSLTTQVFAEVVDTALEDELGALALVGARVHDTHPLDPAHEYEVRRDTIDLTAITNLAQATQTAQKQLDILSQRTRTVDAGIIGNPALQKTDYVAVVDPVTSLSTGFSIDTYRSSMNASGTYVGTLALIPVEDVTDAPTDDGSAS